MMNRGLENQRLVDEHLRVFHELSGLVMSLLRSPMMPMPSPDRSRASVRRPHNPPPVLSRKKISPAGFAWLLLGISVSLMVCGSITFLIGFMLMPWLLGLVVVLYVAGIISAVSALGRSIICYAASSQPPMEIPEWKLM
ncbi:hypothetical protein like AT1G27290 [Hibiscus trionum]|uniref:Transmembrane protein n=1 Tax=Hibiscus trionum TaxID=183268 RepID=A0A9W7I2L7_HIBTR|nr:hypothetical protein like AT1G27290 [Hibiscus trionum]